MANKDPSAVQKAAFAAAEQGKVCWLSLCAGERGERFFEGNRPTRKPWTLMLVEPAGFLPPKPQY